MIISCKLSSEDIRHVHLLLAFCTSKCIFVYSVYVLSVRF